MIQTLHRIIAVIFLFSAGVMFQACGPAYDMYCNIYARFVVRNVLNVSPTLYRSCTSLGEFCTLTNPVGGAMKLYFKSIGPADPPYPMTAQEAKSFVLGLGGLIVGLPSLAEQLEEEPKVVCFDLTCPNCYTDYNISHQLRYTRLGYVDCTSCGRSYDLNSSGIVSSGETGRALFRYRVNYYQSTNALSIDNR